MQDKLLYGQFKPALDIGLDHGFPAAATMHFSLVVWIAVENMCMHTTNSKSPNQHNLVHLRVEKHLHSTT